MNAKTLVRLGILIGSTVGGYVPTFFGAELLSFSALFGSLIGGIVGVWIAYKVDEQL
jgi:uncharacterized membrane protein YeaQ/YmgE (transglycosylase-associated protein family)